MVTRAHWLPAALLCLTGCLTAPQLKECIDFDLADTAENPACEDSCETYCSALVRICPNQATGANPLVACRAGCQEFGADDALAKALDCRFSVLRAARGNSDLCESAGIGGGTQCPIELCDEYCFLARRDCSGMYSTFEQCQQICDTFPQDGTSLGGDSVQCRIAQLSDASAAGCNAASIASDGTCGTACEGYCAQAMAHCEGAVAVFPDEAACLASCALIPQGQFNDWDGSVGANSLMCRAYHASSPAQDDAPTHCPHAAIYNDQKCGSICEAYCDPLMCGGQFPGIDECVDECVRLVTEREPLFPDPAATLQCDQ
ncbi:MAG: hypothetical protein ACI9U2_002749 [Bradymonadia bacterium]|jgi:hypothetical protein